MSSVQVQFAIDDVTQGEAIVVELLNQRLVACAQTVGPVTSRYWWRDSINETQEWLFVCKTTSHRLDETIEGIRLRHPYEVPEIVATEINAGYGPYVDWIGAETHTPPDTARS